MKTFTIEPLSDKELKKKVDSPLIKKKTLAHKALEDFFKGRFPQTNSIIEQIKEIDIKLESLLEERQELLDKINSGKILSTSTEKEIEAIIKYITSKI